MSTRLFTSIVALMLSITLIASSVVLISPQKVLAQVPGVPTIGVGPVEITTSLKSTITAIEEVLNTASTYTNTAANYANMINAYVLQPLAFVLSGNLMKALTSSVIGFVIGKANGTGAPQFVVDIQRSMQTVADGRALAYLRQINQTQSPFSSSIRSALASSYLTKSSLAGFWAANMNTLNATSIPSYRSDYLSGNWSSGGVAAWFALTTQTQNNPYTLAQNMQSQLLNVIGPGAGGATGARAQELSFGQGFMSWCSTNDEATAASSASIAASKSMAGMAPKPDTKGTFYDAMGSAYLTQADASAADEINGAASKLANLGSGRTAEGGVGINPGDPCSNKDGTTGTIKTPGSVIKSTLDKVLGGQQDQIVRMGNVGPQVNQILGNIGTVLNTVNFAASLLGGDKQGGLLAVNSTSASRSISELQQFTPTAVLDSKGNVTDFTTQTLDRFGNVVETSGYLGSAQSDINDSKTSLDAGKAATEAVGATNATAAANTSTSGSDLAGRITNFETAWNTIRASADMASTTVTDLAKFCTSKADAAARTKRDTPDEFGNRLSENTNLNTISNPFIDASRQQAVDAQTALTTEIVPVFANYDAASTTIKSARLTLEDNPTALANPASVQTQMGTPPTSSDVSYAQQNARAYGAPALNTDGSENATLFVRISSSVVDQMNNITRNAQALQATVCNPYSSAYSYPSGFGISG